MAAMAVEIEESESRKTKHDICCKMRRIVGGCRKIIVIVKELLGKEAS